MRQRNGLLVDASREVVASPEELRRILGCGQTEDETVGDADYWNPVLDLSPLPESAGGGKPAPVKHAGDRAARLLIGPK